MSFEIIKTTSLPNDAVIVTAKRTESAYFLRPFATFTITPTSRYALNLTDFATEAAALHAHESWRAAFNCKHRAGGFRHDRRIKMTNEEIKQFYADRKKAGEAVDIETCEIYWCWADGANPYDLAIEIPEELQPGCTGREWYVRSDVTDGWVSRHDLPHEKCNALYARMKREQREAAASKGGLKWGDEKAYFFDPRMSWPGEDRAAADASGKQRSESDDIPF